MRTSSPCPWLSLPLDWRERETNWRGASLARAKLARQTVGLEGVDTPASRRCRCTQSTNAGQCFVQGGAAARIRALERPPASEGRGIGEAMARAVSESPIFRVAWPACAAQATRKTGS